MSEYEPPEHLVVFLQDKGSGCQVNVETSEADANWVRGLMANLEPSWVIADGRAFGFFVSFGYGKMAEDVRAALSNDERIQIVER